MDGERLLSRINRMSDDLRAERNNPERIWGDTQRAQRIRSMEEELDGLWTQYRRVKLSHPSGSDCVSVWKK